jgi:hypothetical protein
MEGAGWGEEATEETGAAKRGGQRTDGECMDAHAL